LARQKASAHPIGKVAQAQVKAGGLDLFLGKRVGGRDGTAIGQGLQNVVGQNPVSDGIDHATCIAGLGRFLYALKRISLA
jgi:hypothetical protein